MSPLERFTIFIALQPQAAAVIVVKWGYEKHQPGWGLDYQNTLKFVLKVRQNMGCEEFFLCLLL